MESKGKKGASNVSAWILQKAEWVWEFFLGTVIPGSGRVSWGSKAGREGEFAATRGKGLLIPLDHLRTTYILDPSSFIHEFLSTLPHPTDQSGTSTLPGFLCMVDGVLDGNRNTQGER